MIVSPEDKMKGVYDNSREDVTHFFINPYLTNGFSHHYQFGESTFIFRAVRSDF